MSSTFTINDERFMRRALALAARGQGRVEPNPMVGCVIVHRGRVIGEGYHHRFGGPHAEVDALRRVRGSARGATLYVTLEPCCHFGKTPPCTDAIIGAGIARVIVAMRDPFPKVAGKGFRLLRAAGIEVRSGLLEHEASQLNGPYLKRQMTGRPWVILKWAQSLDGRIATRTGDSQWISGEASRRDAHRIRGRVDAIIVGVGTVLRDDPLLNCRHIRPKHMAMRMILDPKLRTPLHCQLVRTARQTPTCIVTDAAIANGARAKTMLHAGVEILALRASKGVLPLGALLDDLGQRGMTNVMVEGGGRTLGLFHDAGLADEAVVFVSPRLIGGEQAVPALAGRGPATMTELRPSSVVKVARRGADLVYYLRLKSDRLQE